MCNVKGWMMFLFSLFLSFQAVAHPLAPTLLKIDMVSETQANIRWKESVSKASGVTVFPEFPKVCTQTSVPEISLIKTAVVFLWEIQCESSLLGQVVQLPGLKNSNATVLVDFGDIAGNRTSTLLGSARDSFVIPHKITAETVVTEYVLSGILHLLLGWDHVLFVVGLFLLLRRHLRKLLLAVTAFTLGHSVTLVIVSLGFIPVGGVLIESFIALSILFLALEILNPSLQQWRFSIKKAPYLLTAGFGLIHGCGFAAVLTEMLSNKATKLLPLVSFNVGIELGQCIILLVLLVLLWVSKFVPRRLQWSSRWIGYGMGVMSVYWLLSWTAL